MIRTLLSLALSSFALTAQDLPAVPAQIAGAVQAAPAEMREGATVLGYKQPGKLESIRPGSNELVCLADDPAKPGFNVACYHKDLEPFMARGRELAASGVTGMARTKQRFQEIEQGKLSMPKEPRTLYVLTGKSFDPTASTVEDSYLRWVIYTPYATAASTGLSTKSAQGVPWLMDPGTPGAHIMISPPRAK